MGLSCFFYIFNQIKFKFQLVNDRRVLSAKNNNESKSWNSYIQSGKGVTADA